MDPYMEELQKIRREIGSAYDPLEDNSPLREDPVGYTTRSNLYISGELNQTPIPQRFDWVDYKMRDLSCKLLYLTCLVEKLCEAFDVKVGGNKPQSESQDKPSNEPSNNVTAGE